MKKTLRRLSAVLLAVIMMLSAIPFVSASVIEDSATNPIYVTADEALEFLTYSVADGEATITGYTTPPYYSVSSDYVTLEIPETVGGYPVTAIGDSAFYDLTVDKMILPASVTEIGNNAFEKAGTLDILVASGVTKIGDFAFKDSDIYDFTLPENLNQLGKGAFLGCEYLESINISEDNGFFCSVNGVLFNESKDELIAYPMGKADTIFTVPVEVEEIAPYAFCKRSVSSELTEVILSNVVTIGDYAFEYAKLTKISLGTALVNIGDSAFENCSFTEIVLPDTVRTIGKEAFAYSGTVNAISVPEGVERLEDGVFTGLTTLETLNLPSTLSYIGDDAVNSFRLMTVNYNGTLEDWLKVEKHIGYGFEQDTIYNFNDGTSHIHAIDYKDVVDSTCDTLGSKVPYCTTCGEVFETETIYMKAHTEGEWIITTPATTKVNGEKTKYCTVCNKVLKTEVVTELSPGVEEVTYIKSTDTHNSFVVTVIGRASMVQFIEPDGGTRTYYRNNPNVKIQAYNQNGNAVSSLNRELAYEHWEINTNLSANVEIKVRAKYYYAEEKAHRWDTNIYKFTVQLGIANPDADLYGLIVNNSGPKGPIAVKVIVGPDAEGVRFVMPNGTTTTYVKSKGVLDSESGNLVFTGKAWANEAGGNKIIVQVKVNRVWQTVDNFVYYAA